MADFLATALVTWQAELERLLANPEAGLGAEGGVSRRRFYFRIQNCMNVDQDSGTISFMKLPRNTIINIPIVATLVAQVPLNKENNSFEIELLTRPADGGSVVIGLVDRTFGCRKQPGHRKRSVGLQLNDLSMWKDGLQTDGAAVCCELAVGDRVGCELEENDVSVTVYFTYNGTRISEGIHCEGDGTADSAQSLWFPAVTTMSQQDQVRLVSEATWRPSRKQNLPAGKDLMKVNKSTGQLTFRSTLKKNEEKKSKSCSLVALRPFTSSCAFFEVEVIALGKGDEICVGAASHNHPRNHLPGSVLRESVGYRGRLGAICIGDGKKGSSKSSSAPEVAVGDKLGCGIERRGGDTAAIYFTHNSETFKELIVKSNIRDQLHPAIGLRSAGGSAVCVCIQDMTPWLDAEGLEEDEDSKAAHVDMKLTTHLPPADIKVNKETARATFQSEIGLLGDGLLVASQPFSSDLDHFEIEIAYGTHITVGVVSAKYEKKAHPGFAQGSIGYNIGEGLVYTNGKPSAMASGQKKLTSNYGDRLKCGVRAGAQADGKISVYFEKNGEMICEIELPIEEIKQEHAATSEAAAAEEVQLFAALGMRSAGHQQSVMLLNRELWGCIPARPTSDTKNMSALGGDQGHMTSFQTDEMVKLLDRELIECPICREVFTDPRIFPCSAHSFCAECLREYVGLKKSVTCPVCRKNCTIPPGGSLKLPCNNSLAKLIEVYKALGKH